VKDVENAGGKALAILTDVADYDQVEAAAAQVEETFGPIDVWINVAFTSVFAPFHEITPEEFRRVTEVSYLGFVYGTMVALSRMRPRDRGTIVQVGSALGARSIPLQSANCGAKHAINGFTESLRTELMHEHSNIHVTIAQMPAVNTPQFSWVLSRLPNHPQPVPPIYQPEVAARGVVFAADRPQRKQYWVGASTVGTLIGQDRPCDAGPLPGPHRLLRPADRSQGRTRPSAQPLGACRRTRRPRPRRARHVRRAGPPPRPATVVVPPRPAGVHRDSGGRGHGAGHRDHPLAHGHGTLASVNKLTNAHRQASYSLRMDWAPAGANAVVEGCDVAVVVDVLSFTTTLSVAADCGVTVFPYRWRDDRAEVFAAEHHATLAVGRSAALPGQVSLSPHSFRTAPSLERLVLPSPNGSTISFQLAQAGSKVPV